MFSYVNVDYAVASALVDDTDAGIEDIVITYDIGCQWGKNISDRLTKATFIPSLNVKSFKSFHVTVLRFYHRVQRLFSHGSWAIQCDKSS